MTLEENDRNAIKKLKLTPLARPLGHAKRIESVTRVNPEISQFLKRVNQRI
jgi:hypothetical protein